MKKETFVIVKKEHTTGCGKHYAKNAIGIVKSDLDKSDDTYAVRFPRHREGDYSWMPDHKLEVAPDQEKAKELFDKGVEECTTAIYK